MGGAPIYWDIHYMLSPDGGATCKTPPATPLKPPIVPDNTGPTLRITLDDEFEPNTWLSSFLAKDSKLHFVYLSRGKPARQHYMRYDLATGRRDIDRQPRFGGKDIHLAGLDGFFASRPDKPGSHPSGALRKDLLFRGPPAPTPGQMLTTPTTPGPTAACP